jgi:hypothetical protein
MYFDHVFRAPSEAFHSRKTLIDRYFKLAENQTTIKQEMLGGLTTFVTMAYIIVVNPQILAQAGMPPEGVLFATCISAATVGLSHPSQSPVHPRVVTAEEIEPVAYKTLGTRSGGVVRQHLTHDLRAPLLTLTRASAILWLQPGGIPGWAV